MPTLFGSEYLLPAIIVVVLLLTLLMLMSSRRRAATGAAPVKERSRRRKRASVEAESVTSVEAESVAVVETEPVAVVETEPIASSTVADIPAHAELAVVEPVAAMTEDVPAAVMPEEGSADAVSPDLAAIEAAEDLAQAGPSERRRRSGRRGARMTVRTRTAGSAAPRPDPLRLALVDILAGWGDLSAEDTKRLELFRAEKVMEAIAAIELPGSKSGEYARTRLTQLRQYSADLERRSSPLHVVNPDAELTMPLSDGTVVAEAPGVEAGGAALVAPIMAASFMTTSVVTSPAVMAPEGGAVSPGADEQAIAAPTAATIIDFYGSSTDTTTEELVTEEPVSADPEPEPYEALAAYEALVSYEGTESYEAPLPYEAPLYYESAVSYESSAVDETDQPPVDAVAAAKLPQYDPDDPETFWTEPYPTQESPSPAADEDEVLETSAGAAAAVGGSLWDDPPADALSRLSVKVETAEQLLALPPEERIDMTAFLEPSELTATFRATEDPELKKAVIDTLEHIGSPASLTALGYCFDDPDGDVQLYALQAADRLLGVA